MANDWKTHWREVCAPKLLEQKKKLGRDLPEHEIASYVELKTGKPSGRGLVWSWLHGEREPFISQFFALCEKLELEPIGVLGVKPDRTLARKPLFQTGAADVKSSRRRSAR